MPAVPIHEDEVRATVEQVNSLVAAQCPQWAGLTVIEYDDATWHRACGWAIAPALTGIDYYRHTFPRMAEYGRRMVRAVIAELA